MLRFFSTAKWLGNSAQGCRVARLPRSSLCKGQNTETLCHILGPIKTPRKKSHSGLRQIFHAARYSRGAISLTPWLQPGDLGSPTSARTVSNGFSLAKQKPLETVHHLTLRLNHPAEAMVLMRSLRGLLHNKESSVPGSNTSNCNQDREFTYWLVS
jgi:hypothetical protein